MKVVKWNEQVHFPAYGEQLKEWFAKYKVAPTHLDGAFIAVSDDGKDVLGLAGFKNVVFFEPLLTDNPLVAKTLVDTVHGILMNSDISRVRLMIDKEDQAGIDVRKKYGYEILEDNKVIMEKSLWVNPPEIKDSTKSVENSETSQAN